MRTAKKKEKEKRPTEFNWTCVRSVKLLHERIAFWFDLLAKLLARQRIPVFWGESHCIISTYAVVMILLHAARLRNLTYLKHSKLCRIEEFFEILFKYLYLVLMLNREHLCEKLNQQWRTFNVVFKILNERNKNERSQQTHEIGRTIQATKIRIDNKMEFSLSFIPRGRDETKRNWIHF